MKEQQKGVHYFPGHMKRALGELRNMASLCDVLLELLDARAPLASRNPLLRQICPEKPRIIVLTKIDLADPKTTEKWIEALRKETGFVLPLDGRKKEAVSFIRKTAEEAATKKREKERKAGMKPQPLRLCVFGIPNVGKSTLINTLSGRKSAKAENRPGVTRSQQWIRLSEDLSLLDSPGILPMHYEDEETAIVLSWLGSIPDTVLPSYELSSRLLSFLKENYPVSLQNRYGIKDIESKENHETFEDIAKMRGFLGKDGVPDTEKSALLLLKETRDGILGRISLETPDA